MSMTNTVAQMTKEELREIIESVVESTIEQKLLEILGDPDDDSEIQQTLLDRLLSQKRAVEIGERGQPFEEAIQQLGLE